MASALLAKQRRLFLGILITSSVQVAAWSNTLGIIRPNEPEPVTGIREELQPQIPRFRCVCRNLPAKCDMEVANGNVIGQFTWASKTETSFC